MIHTLKGFTAGHWILVAKNREVVLMPPSQLPVKPLAQSRYIGFLKFCVFILQNFAAIFIPALSSCLINLISHIIIYVYIYSLYIL